MMKATSTSAQTVARFTEAGAALTGLIAASNDNRDRYKSLHWRALEEWLATQTEADEIRSRHMRRRDDYFEVTRRLLGWAIFVGRKPSH